MLGEKRTDRHIQEAVIALVVFFILLLTWLYGGQIGYFLTKSYNASP